MFIANFKNAKRFNKTLKKNLINNIAREKLIKINQHINLVNKQRGYSRTQLIIIPSYLDTNVARFESKTNKELFRSTKDTKAIKKGDQASSKDDVKIKVSVLVFNKLYDRTSFEKVVIVKSASFGSRVIVNRETNMNPYYDIYFGATFKKEVVQQ